MWIARGLSAAFVWRSVGWWLRSPLVRDRQRRWMLAVAGLAAVLLLAVFLMRARPVYAAAAKDHRLEIVELQPRKWSTDRASIAALAQRQGVPDSAIDLIAPAGYHLAQGKLCFLDGKVFLHLVYANDAGKLSVFLRPADRIEADACREPRRGACRGISGSEVERAVRYGAIRQRGAAVCAVRRRCYLMRPRRASSMRA